MERSVRILNRTDAANFAGDYLGFHPDDTQAAILRGPTQRLILNCTRQWGKSTTTAALVTHHLCFGNPTTLAIVLSPSARQSAELLRKISTFSTKLGVRPRGDGDNEYSILFPNGARAVALPGTDGTIRGFSSVSLLVIDEAARVPDTVYRAARPMLAASNGRLILLSTPNGRRGFFYHEWTNNPNWTKITVPATECPRISQQFLADERNALGEWSFRQEYLCEFMDANEQIFPFDLVHSSISTAVTPLLFA